MSQLKLCGLLLTFSAAFYSTSAQAFYKTGEALYAHLKEFEVQDPDMNVALRAAHATGYVLGVSESFNGNIDSVTKLRFCLIEGVTTTGDVLAVTTTYLKSNPNLRNRPARTLVVQALANQYPCK